MPIVFVSGLPRSSTLGLSDLLYQSINTSNKSVFFSGHIHLAAALSDVDLSLFSSPLHLYDSREALVRFLLSLHKIPISLEACASVNHFYFPNSGGVIDHDRLKNTLNNSESVVIDPSFSHTLHPHLFSSLPEIKMDYLLVIFWRNPIQFSLDLMKGVFSLDCCLHWILAKPSFGFPLDPLMIWLEIVKTQLKFLKSTPASISNIYHLRMEKVINDGYLRTLNNFPLMLGSTQRPSALSDVSSLFYDCPYSGDPSYHFNSSYSLEVSRDQLHRLSRRGEVIDEVMDLSISLGYQVVG